MTLKPSNNFIKKRSFFLTRLFRQILSFVQSEKKQYLLQLLVCLGIIVFFLRLLNSNSLSRFENLALDTLFKLQPVSTSSTSPIVYIELAEESIQTIGQFPWPRYYHAALIHILQEWQVKAIVFDLVFERPSTDAFNDKAFYRLKADFADGDFAF